MRHLTCADGTAYFAAHDGTENRGVYQKSFRNGEIRLLQGGFREAPHELCSWNKQLIFSVPGASLWTWDGMQARELMKIHGRGSKAAGQFTPFGGELFFVSPPTGKKAAGGELWKTDGTKAGTVKVRDGLWMLLGGGNIRQPNNFSRFRDKLLLSSRRRKPKGGPGSPHITLTDGANQNTHSFPPGVDRLRQITNVGDHLFFYTTATTRGRQVWQLDPARAAQAFKQPAGSP